MTTQLPPVGQAKADAIYFATGLILKADSQESVIAFRLGQEGIGGSTQAVFNEFFLMSIELPLSLITHEQDAACPLLYYLAMMKPLAVRWAILQTVSPQVKQKSNHYYKQS